MEGLCKLLKAPQIGSRGPGLTPGLGDGVALALGKHTLMPVICDMGTMTIFLWTGSEEAVNEVV